MTLFRFLLAALPLMLGSGCANNPELLDTAIQIARQGAGNGALSTGEISAGLKEALRVASANVTRQLGATDGFNADPAIHIPLPDSLRKARDIAGKLGLSRSFADLETRLNRAAEQAAPAAKQLFWDAISQMTLQDAKGILYGPDDAATRYFQQKMSAPLARKMKPIVNQTVSQAGVIQAWDNAVGRLGPLAPALPDYKQQLIDHVVKRGMDGIFHYIAQEEAAIRKDPAKRVTALLKKVFGATGR